MKKKITVIGIYEIEFDTLAHLVNTIEEAASWIGCGVTTLYDASKTSISKIEEIREELKQKQGLTIKSGAYARTFTYDDRLPSTIDILETLKEFEANKKESQQIRNLERVRSQ